MGRCRRGVNSCNSTRHLERDKKEPMPGSMIKGQVTPITSQRKTYIRKSMTDRGNITRNTRESNPGSGNQEYMFSTQALEYLLSAYIHHLIVTIQVIDPYPQAVKTTERNPYPPPHPRYQKIKQNQWKKQKYHLPKPKYII